MQWSLILINLMQTKVMTYFLICSIYASFFRSSPRLNKSSVLLLYEFVWSTNCDPSEVSWCFLSSIYSEPLPFTKRIILQPHHFLFKNLLKSLDKCCFLLKHEAWTRHIKVFVPWFKTLVLFKPLVISSIFFLS